MVAALADFQISVVPRRQLDSLGRDQIHVGIVRLRQMLVHRLHHAFGVVRPGDGEHRGMHPGDHALLRAEATRDDHSAVLGERFADRVERFLDRRIDEAAGVDDHQVGVVVRR